MLGSRVGNHPHGSSRQFSCKNKS